MVRCRHLEGRKQQNQSSTKLLQPLFSLTLVVSLLAGCGAVQAGPTATPLLPSTTPRPVPPTPTPVPPTSTPTPTALPIATRVPLTAATVISARGDTEWDLVVIGDCQVFRLTPRYAAHLEADLGVKVIVHD